MFGDARSPRPAVTAEKHPPASHPVALPPASICLQAYQKHHTSHTSSFRPPLPACPQADQKRVNSLGKDLATAEERCRELERTLTAQQQPAAAAAAAANIAVPFDLPALEVAPPVAARHHQAHHGRDDKAQQR